MEGFVGTSWCCLLFLLEFLFLAVCPLEVRQLTPSVSPTCLLPLFLGQCWGREGSFAFPAMRLSQVHGKSFCDLFYHRAMGELACLECEGTRILPSSGEGSRGQGLQPVIKTKWDLSGVTHPKVKDDLESLRCALPHLLLLLLLLNIYLLYWAAPGLGCVTRDLRLRHVNS